MLNLIIEKVTQTATIPTYTSENSCGMNLYSNENITILPGEKRCVHTGIKLKFPRGYELEIRPRLEHMSTNLFVASTSIDFAFNNEIEIAIYNSSITNNLVINVGDSIAYAVLSPVVDGSDVNIEEGIV